MVTDIEGQNAHGVMFLDLATRPKLVKSALGHARENVNLETGEHSVRYFGCRYLYNYHRIDAVLLVSLSK